MVVVPDKQRKSVAELSEGKNRANAFGESGGRVECN